MDTQQPRVILAVSHEDAVFPSNMGGGGGERTRLSIQHSTFALLPPRAVPPRRSIIRHVRFVRPFSRKEENVSDD